MNMKKKINSAYKKLLAKLGHKIQGSRRETRNSRRLADQEDDHRSAKLETCSWWPADSNYEVVVGAILTQNTNWNNVEKAIANIKAAGKLNEAGILRMPRTELEELIRCSGFYRQKAERLKLATKKWIELRNEHDMLAIEHLRNALLSVKGIGKETADSIILYAFHKPIFVIDAYTRRFCKEHFDFEAKEYDEYRTLFESNLERDVNLFKEYHALIVEWAKERRKEKGYSEPTK